MEQLLTYAEAASFLRVPRGTLYSMVSRRLVPHLRLSKRLVRFSKEALERWVAEHERSGVQPVDGGAR